MPPKRRRDDDGGESREAALQAAAAGSSPILAAFAGYSATLTGGYDLHERLVKISRDITTQSKRTIFLLHRIRRRSEAAPIIAEARQSLESVRDELFAKIVAEVKDKMRGRFVRAYSPGVQEFVEAYSFLHYMEHSTLVTLSDLNSFLSTSVPAELEIVTLRDFIGGIADLTGELMRVCVSTEEDDVPPLICKFVRIVHSGFRSLDLGRGMPEYDNKLGVMEASLRKIEEACFTLKVRQGEFPKGRLQDAMDEQAGEEPGE
eukprot:m.51471 g.51471  ORF g.51471 m.51471 type:complete len:261 (+) comp12994_c0_seq1:45-827(+)